MNKWTFSHMKTLLLHRSMLSHRRMTTTTKNNNILLSHDIHMSPIVIETTQKQHQQQDIVFLHGILGSKKNFRTLCRRLLQTQPQAYRRAIAVDHRGHGNSSSLLNSNDSNTLSDCVSDLHRLLSHTQIHGPHYSLVGHSFGGKVVLNFLRDCVDSGRSTPPSQVWVLDCLPGLYNNNNNDSESVWKVLSSLQSLPTSFVDRSSAVQSLVDLDVSKPIADWLATSLVSDDNNNNNNDNKDLVRFGFSLSVVQDLFSDFSSLDLWEVLTDQRLKDTKIHFVRAGRNKLWTEEVLKRFSKVCEEHSNVHVWTMPHVGHWLHAEDMNGLLEVMRKGREE